MDSDRLASDRCRAGADVHTHSQSQAGFAVKPRKTGELFDSLQLYGHPESGVKHKAGTRADFYTPYSSAGIQRRIQPQRANRAGPTPPVANTDGYSGWGSRSMRRELRERPDTMGLPASRAPCR